MKITPALFGIALLVFVINCQQHASDEEFDSTGVKLYFSCPGSSFQYGHKYECEIKLVNEGTKPVRVILLDTPLDSRPRILSNMYIHMLPLDYQYLGHRSTWIREPTTENDIVTLYAGDEIHRHWDLD